MLLLTYSERAGVFHFPFISFCHIPCLVIALQALYRYTHTFVAFYLCIQCFWDHWPRESEGHYSQGRWITPRRFRKSPLTDRKCQSTEGFDPRLPLINLQSPPVCVAVQSQKRACFSGMISSFRLRRGATQRANNVVSFIFHTFGCWHAWSVAQAGRKFCYTLPSQSDKDNHLSLSCLEFRRVVAKRETSEATPLTGDQPQDSHRNVSTLRQSFCKYTALSCTRVESRTCLWYFSSFVLQGGINVACRFLVCKLLNVL